MTRLFALATWALFAMLSAARGQELRQFHDPLHYFKLTHPTDWESLGEDDLDAPQVAQFLRPGEPHESGLREHVSVTAIHLDEPTEAQKVFRSTRDALAGRFEIVEDVETKLSGLPARRVTFKRDEGGWERRATQWIATDGSLVYVVSFIASAESVERYSPAAEAIVESIEVTAHLTERDDGRQDVRLSDPPLQLVVPAGWRLRTTRLAEAPEGAELLLSLWSWDKSSNGGPATALNVARLRNPKDAPPLPKDASERVTLVATSTLGYAGVGAEDAKRRVTTFDSGGNSAAAFSIERRGVTSQVIILQTPVDDEVLQVTLAGEGHADALKAIAASVGYGQDWAARQ